MYIKKDKYSAILVGISLTFSLVPAVSADTVVHSKIKTIAGQTYHFVKIMDDKGNIRSEARNAKGQRISEKSIPVVRPSVVHPKVSAWLDEARRAGREDQTLTVNVALNHSTVEPHGPMESVKVEIREGQLIEARVNGRQMNPQEFRAEGERSAKTRQAASRARSAARAELLKKWVARHKLDYVEGAQEAVARAGSSATLTLNARQLRALIEARDESIAGIEVRELGGTEITQAMAATNITDWALPFNERRGNGVGIYMTESHCPAATRVTNYTRLSGTEGDHSRNVAAIIRAVSPDSYLYCRTGGTSTQPTLTLPLASDFDGVGGNPPIRIITASYGTSAIDDDNYKTEDRDWDDMSYNNDVVMFKSAGNKRSETETHVTSPGKGLNVITVGNYDDATNTINPLSLYANPETGNSKPQLSAPGTNITAGGFIYSGTSMAAPHAAAFMADMMSVYPDLVSNPALARSAILAGATDIIDSAGTKVGLGGIDFRSGGHTIAVLGNWFGASNEWTKLDKLDGVEDGFITVTHNVQNLFNKIRVVIAWQTRGTYTYANRTGLFPVGMDLDLQVIGPDGAIIDTSASWNNSYEHVTFMPTKTGIYKFRVARLDHPDTDLRIALGMTVNPFIP